MKIFKNIIFTIQILAISFSFFIVTAQKTDAACGYSLAESGCSIIYDGSGFQTANGASCAEFAGQTDYAAQGTVCATSPNSCNFSSCQASNTITKCNSTGLCSDVSTVPHPWNVCSSSYSTCTAAPPPTVFVPPPTIYVPPPTIYVPPPTVFVPPPTPYSCPVPSTVQNVRITCPFCL